MNGTIDGRLSSSGRVVAEIVERLQDEPRAVERAGGQHEPRGGEGLDRVAGEVAGHDLDSVVQFTKLEHQFAGGVLDLLILDQRIERPRRDVEIIEPRLPERQLSYLHAARAFNCSDSTASRGRPSVNPLARNCGFRFSYPASACEASRSSRSGGCSPSALPKCSGEVVARAGDADLPGDGVVVRIERRRGKREVAEVVVREAIRPCAPTRSPARRRRSFA
jgi:hypothetical protein